MIQLKSFTIIAALLLGLCLLGLGQHRKRAERKPAKRSAAQTSRPRAAKPVPPANTTSRSQRLAARRSAAEHRRQFDYVNDIVVSSASGQRVYAATRRGLFRSLDGGATWTRALDPQLGAGCLDPAIRTDQASDFIFASCGSFGQAVVYGFSGDGGPATEARLNFPTGVALDGSGNLLIADTGNHRIRKVTAAGVIGTVAARSGEPATATLAGRAGRSGHCPTVDGKAANGVRIGSNNSSNNPWWRIDAFRHILINNPDPAGSTR